MKLTGIILTHNSEKTISRALKSILFCDEIIIVDDYSNDSTLNIVSGFKSTKVKVYKRLLDDDFSAQRNFGLSKAKGEWVLFLDSDEEVTPALRNEIIQVINNPLKSLSGLKIVRRKIFQREIVKTTEAGKTAFVRVAKKKSGMWKRKVHEVWDVKGPVITLKSYLLHNQSEGVSSFLKKINYYSSLHADANFIEKKRSSLLKIVFFPLLKFIKNWIFAGGIKQKKVGFLMSLLMSIHSFLSWSKLWIKQNQN